MSIGPSDPGRRFVDSKRISVSKKRQITIPQRFYDSLNIGQEVECIMTNSEIIIRPVKQETEFAEEILKDLIAKGFQGEQLLDEFKKTRSQIRPAIQKMFEEAELIAKNNNGSGDDKMKEMFSGRED
ncbi:AbrB/MazE/SpoVT family DNA-binding domain-containing protein [Phosphitispora fastidiosa]|uniref:AbrB/MazE/SpoVT family DNA-binding domain-containing protein n=1 Tax=Phosphitispora fastidiosa TaxID=2837202 RepID=UPI001E288B8B|nr:AbrB/MazE/SpoVT family DNA-binding domain-containing protein [Phosphitispora fastidiosa]MBU7005103.1 bifunctional DNA-binding transcriptional regulator/antitoxin component of YhaV-PrlF toxin-antitoxin module [Phosphitispora fastidiosa]